MQVTGAWKLAELSPDDSTELEAINNFTQRSLSIPFDNQQNGWKTGSLRKQQLMFFLNVWIYFDLDESIFQMLIIKFSNPTASVFSKLLQYHQIIHKHQRKTT